MDIEIRVLLYPKRSEQKAGLCPLMGKITLKGKTNSTAAFGCKIKVNPNIWNSTAQRCIGRSREAANTNKEIENLLQLINIRFEELKYRPHITARDVKNRFQGIAEVQVKLLELFQEHIDCYAMRVGINRTQATYYQYCHTYKLCAEFIKSKYKMSDVIIKQLDIDFIKAFNEYLRTKKGLGPGTVIGHINRVTKVIRIAIDSNIIPTNPFEDFVPERPVKKRRYLTTEEFSKLMTTSFNTYNLNLTRDMFLFASFTGLSYCDICKLTVLDLQRDHDGSLWIRIPRKKTGTVTNIMLLDIPLKLIEKYEGVSKNGKLFPMLSNSDINLCLKEIDKICGINRDLTFHMARHTFATLICLQNGVPIETIRLAMGHRYLYTTQQYAKVTIEKIDHDISILEERIKGKYTLNGINEPPSKILRDRKKSDKLK